MQCCCVVFTSTISNVRVVAAFSNFYFDSLSFRHATKFESFQVYSFSLEIASGTVYHLNTCRPVEGTTSARRFFGYDNV